jgi:hypothetical protein
MQVATLVNEYKEAPPHVRDIFRKETPCETDREVAFVAASALAH